MVKRIFLWVLVFSSPVLYSQDIVWANDSIKTDDVIETSCSVTNGEDIYMWEV